MSAKRVLSGSLAPISVYTTKRTTSPQVGSEFGSMNQEHYALTLQLAPGIGPRRARAIMETHPDAETFFKEKPENAPPNWLSTAEWKEKQQVASMLLDKHESSGIQSLSIFHPAYPEALKNIPDAPIILFVKGQLDYSYRSLSVVGTRDPTPMGMEATKEFIEGLVPYQCAIVSGLARGIDTQAHRSAVHLQIPTWAVLAHGLHAIHPKENHHLGERIIGEGGAWLSEWPIGTPPRPGAFPRRNRIIAGLTHGTLVVEAAIKSGAGITAQFAQQYDRAVFAIPGRIKDVRSQGCLALIQRQVAQIVLHPNHIAEELGWSKREAPLAMEVWPESHQKIWLSLEGGPLRLMTISERTHLGSETCLQALAEMMWEGDIRATHGWYARDGPMA